MKATISLRHSVVTHLMKVVFGCYLIVTLFVTGIQVILEYYHVKNSIFHEIQALPDSFGPGISESVWTYNNELLHSILIGMLEISVIEGIVIRDTNGYRKQAVGTIPDEKAGRIRIDHLGESSEYDKLFFSSLFDYEFPIEYQWREKKHILGKCIIYSSHRHVIERLKYGFFLILVNLFVKTLALWFIVMFLGLRIIGSPLRHMAEAAENEPAGQCHQIYRQRRNCAGSQRNGQRQDMFHGQRYWHRYFLGRTGKDIRPLSSDRHPGKTGRGNRSGAVRQPQSGIAYGRKPGCGKQTGNWQHIPV
ncbi:Uncharacterized protein dnm_056850 [Desulfonema magnum]|uniref:Uncharacterized protein n=1 Tax=Desulfonema magnum TaxID=45655 RepID=A0A975BPT0_9BACT|nr:Uncharacterized protein dnm_056850 [Desulfonema magnum]